LAVQLLPTRFDFSEMA